MTESQKIPDLTQYWNALAQKGKIKLARKQVLYPLYQLTYYLGGLHLRKIYNKIFFQFPDTREARDLHGVKFSARGCFKKNLLAENNFFFTFLIV